MWLISVHINSFLFFFSLILFTFIFTSYRNYWILLMGRAIGGLAIGMLHFLIPLYINDIVPIHQKSLCHSIMQLQFVLGILSQYILSKYCIGREPQKRQQRPWIVNHIQNRLKFYCVGCVWNLNCVRALKCGCVVCTWMCLLEKEKKNNQNVVYLFSDKWHCKCGHEFEWIMLLAN